MGFKVGDIIRMSNDHELLCSIHDHLLVLGDDNYDHFYEYDTLPLVITKDNVCDKNVVFSANGFKGYLCVSLDSLFEIILYDDEFTLDILTTRKLKLDAIKRRK